MNETYYLEVGSIATDRFMELVGADAAYVAGGQSYFTVESHLRHLGEVHAGDRIRAETQVLGGTGRRMHLFHRMIRGDGQIAATMETLLVHVDLTTRRSSDPSEAVSQRLSQFVESHSDLPRPDGAGRYVGERTSKV